MRCPSKRTDMAAWLEWHRPRLQARHSQDEPESPSELERIRSTVPLTPNPPRKKDGIAAWIEWHRQRNLHPKEKPKRITLEPQYTWVRTRNNMILIGGLGIVIFRGGAISVFDAEDVTSVARHCWRIDSKHGKSYPTTGRKHTQMARVILGLPDEVVPDHMNGCGMDNRRRNIRAATQRQNLANRAKSSRFKTSSRFKGVSWRKKECKFNARIAHLGQAFDLGNFDEEVEAALAYDRKAREIHGEFACCNFPLEITA